MKQKRAKTGGRKKGVPNKSGAALKVAAQAYTDEALSVLVGIMKDEEAPHAARLRAADSILDRGHGKPMQAVEDKDTTQLEEQLADMLNKLATQLPN